MVSLNNLAFQHALASDHATANDLIEELSKVSTARKTSLSDLGNELIAALATAPANQHCSFDGGGTPSAMVLLDTLCQKCLLCPARIIFQLRVHTLQALSEEGLANYFTRHQTADAIRLWHELLRLTVAAAAASSTPQLQQQPQLYFLNDGSTMALMQQWPEDRVSMHDGACCTSWQGLAGWAGHSGVPSWVKRDSMAASRHVDCVRVEEGCQCVLEGVPH